MRAFQVTGHGGEETHARNAICVEGSCSPSQIHFPQVSGGPGTRTFKLKKKKNKEDGGDWLTQMKTQHVGVWKAVKETTGLNLAHRGAGGRRGEEGTTGQ